jgi:hypothetical protein
MAAITITSSTAAQDMTLQLVTTLLPSLLLPQQWLRDCAVRCLCYSTRTVTHHSHSCRCYYCQRFLQLSRLTITAATGAHRFHSLCFLTCSNDFTNILNDKLICCNCLCGSYTPAFLTCIKYFQLMFAAVAAAMIVVSSAISTSSNDCCK